MMKALRALSTLCPMYYSDDPAIYFSPISVRMRNNGYRKRKDEILFGRIYVAKGEASNSTENDFFPASAKEVIPTAL